MLKKIMEGKRSSVMALCLGYGILAMAASKLGVNDAIVTGALTFGGALAGLYFGGQSVTDAVQNKVASSQVGK